MKPIAEIAKTAGIDEKYLEQYGKYKAKVDYALLRESERKDGKVKNGDAINIDFVGYMDGAAFDGGTAFGFAMVRKKRYKR